MSDFEFDDVQGLVRFGHGRLPEAEFLLVEIKDAKSASEWLQKSPVTTSERLPSPPDVALQVALSAQGMAALGLDEALINDFSPEFQMGIAGEDNRSRRLGDIGANAPGNWQWGQEPPHLLLMLYARKDGLQSWRKKVCNKLFKQAFTVTTTLPTHDIGEIEPFGFIDGISQPKIDWEQTFPTDRHSRDSYANMLAPGEVLLGYLNEYGEYAPRPLLNSDADGADQLPRAEDQPDGHDLGRNGTYLVLRQLHQDVRGFWQFLDKQAGGDAERRDQLGAAMVGRHRDGTALVADNARIAGSQSGNNFTYDDDPDGLVCPIGAHIRRANPRTGDHPPGVRGFWSRIFSALGFRRRRDGKPGRHDLVASTRFHRLFRRGREYGSHLPIDEALKDGPEEERGLHFICLCSNILRQFEFVQNAWISVSKFDGIGSESDPLLGNRAPVQGSATDRFTLPQASGAPKRIDGLPQFVTVRGGAYFFMPGIRALRFIARNAG